MAQYPVKAVKAERGPLKIEEWNIVGNDGKPIAFGMKKGGARVLVDRLNNYLRPQKALTRNSRIIHDAFIWVDEALQSIDADKTVACVREAHALLSREKLPTHSERKNDVEETMPVRH